MFEGATAFDQNITAWGASNAEFKPSLWYMAFLTNVTASNVENSLDALLSQSYSISNQPFDVRYYKYDCKTELIHSINQKNNVKTVDEAHPGFVTLKASAILNSSEVFYADRDGIYDGDETGGDVNLCIRADLYLSDDKIFSMNFLEKKVTISVNLKNANLDVGGIDTDSDPGDEVPVDYSIYIEAYQCNPSNAGVTNYDGTYAQGSNLHICVKSKNSEVIDVESIQNMLIEQDVDANEKKFQYITDGRYNSAFANVDCETNSSPMKICIARLNLVELFFEEANPPSLKVSGNVALALPNTSTSTSRGETSQSRLLRGKELQLESSKHGRALTEVSRKFFDNGSFNVDVNLVSSKMSIATSKASKGTISMSSLASSAAVILVAILFM
jgi:hypothetical protein